MANDNKNEIGIIIGVILILFGGWKLTRYVLDPWWSAIASVVKTAMGIIWPIAVIAVGIFLIYLTVSKRFSPKLTGKKLYRSRSSKLGGVYAGLADFFSVDPVIVRIVALLLLFTVFPAILILYIILWIVIPEEPVSGTWT